MLYVKAILLLHPNYCHTNSLYLVWLLTHCFQTTLRLPVSSQEYNSCCPTVLLADMFERFFVSFKLPWSSVFLFLYIQLWLVIAVYCLPFGIQFPDKFAFWYWQKESKQRSSLQTDIICHFDFRVSILKFSRSSVFLYLTFYRGSVFNSSLRSR